MTHRDKRGRFTTLIKESKRILKLTALALIGTAFIVGFYFHQTHQIEYYLYEPIPVAEAKPDTRDDIQKLTDNIAVTAREEMQAFEEVVEATRALERAQARHLEKVEAKNEAIESFNLYQGIIE